MSVYQNRYSPYWHFDFRYQGVRFHASTKTKDRQEAEAIERAERARVKQIGVMAASANPWRPPSPLSPRYRGLCACGEHAWSILTRGYVTLVSPEDAHLLERANWCANRSARSGKKVTYVARGKGQSHVYLHCKILGKKAGEEIDHKNWSGTDNRRSNLRPCSSSQNSASRRRSSSASGFRGVGRNGRGWQAQIQGTYLGTFDTPKEAARIYDAAAKERFNEFAMLNFPSER